MAKVHRSTTTGAGAIALAVTAVPAGLTVLGIAWHSDGAPTTSENLTATIDAVADAAYDTVVRSVDPSARSAVDVFFEGPIHLFAGDALDIAYKNTDTNTIGVTVYWREGTI